MISISLTHFISNYFPQKEGNLLIRGKFRLWDYSYVNIYAHEESNEKTDISINMWTFYNLAHLTCFNTCNYIFFSWIFDAFPLELTRQNETNKFNCNSNWIKSFHKVVMKWEPVTFTYRNWSEKSVKQANMFNRPCT